MAELPKTDFKTCLATCEWDNFECGRPKHTYRQVYKVFSLRIIAEVCVNMALLAELAF